MPMKNDTEGGERSTKKHVRHEASTKESREDRKKRLLKMLEYLDSQEYKDNYMAIHEWSCRRFIFKESPIRHAGEVIVHECKEGVCQVTHNCPEQGKKLPCLNCDPVLVSQDKLKLSIAALKRGILAESKKKNN